MRFSIYILLFIISVSVFSQDFTEEEKKEINHWHSVTRDKSKHDTAIVIAYLQLCEIYYVSHRDSVRKFSKKVVELSEQSLKLNTSPEVIESLRFSLAAGSNNLAIIYKNQGDIPRALKHYYKALKLLEILGEDYAVGMILGNIGSLYDQQGDSEKALEYFDMAIEIYTKIDHPLGYSSILNNIANIHQNKKDYDKALDYLMQSKKIKEENNFIEAIPRALLNIGVVLHAKSEGLDINDKDSLIRLALNNYKEALKISEKLGSKKNISDANYLIGRIEHDRGQLQDAFKSVIQSMEIAQEIGVPSNISKSAKLMSLIYEKQGQNMKALEMYRLHIQMRDSLNNASSQKAAAQQQAKYEYEKQKAVDDAEHEKQLAIEQEAKEKQTILTYATGGGLGLVGIFLIFVFNRLKVTRKQKAIIELAHTELEEKNTEILDSIQYAKRIQSAILPADKVVKENLEESFILYKPKDIVAGDFYWLEQKDNKVLFAAADCTGHGVPGAMVSVVCNNGLNRSVREHNLTDPGKILDKTREIVVAEFEKSEEEVKDGMDIALCSLEGNTLHYAGAHNPLWIIRDGELLETKANKQPIGQFENPEPYTTHAIKLEKGDSLYIFSDGYADQFGGEKGKKMKTANFKKLLLSIQQENMQKQKQLIDEAFENWKGELEQLDDVCVIGVRI